MEQFSMWQKNEEKSGLSQIGPDWTYHGSIATAFQLFLICCCPLRLLCEEQQWISANLDPQDASLFVPLEYLSADVLCKNTKILAQWGSTNHAPRNSCDYIELIEEGDHSNLKFRSLTFYWIFKNSKHF